MSQVGQNSASESRPNFSFQILTKLQAENVDQSLTTKSRPNFTFKNLTKLQTWGILSIGARFFLFLGHIIAILGAVYHLRHVLSIFGALNLSRPFVLKGHAENLLFALFFLKSSNICFNSVDGKILLSVGVMVERWIKREL